MRVIEDELKPNTIEFDFLGKDSIQYQKEVPGFGCLFSYALGASPERVCQASCFDPPSFSFSLINQVLPRQLHVCEPIVLQTVDDPWPVLCRWRCGPLYTTMSSASSCRPAMAKVSSPSRPASHLPRTAFTVALHRFWLYLR